MPKTNWKSWFTFTASRKKSSASGVKFRPQLTVLEGRIVPSPTLPPAAGNGLAAQLAHPNNGNHNGLVNGNHYGQGGQTTLATISGSVIDSQDGTPVVGATVTLTSSTGVTLTTTTDANGNFSFANLQPDTYTLTETTSVGFISTASTAGTAGGDVSVVGQVSSIVVGSGTNATGYVLTESPHIFA
ncbi:MAG TPA: carboxypeptidase-like regulatory domain-containing protein [Gemmataceae bacterium]|nr:carboxypeptidase-like regulatory domain-containing protein [Gemmataceae bacterium]